MFTDIGFLSSINIYYFLLDKERKEYDCLHCFKSYTALRNHMRKMIYKMSMGFFYLDKAYKDGTFKNILKYF